MRAIAMALAVALPIGIAACGGGSASGPSAAPSAPGVPSASATPSDPAFAAWDRENNPLYIAALNTAYEAAVDMAMATQAKDYAKMEPALTSFADAGDALADMRPAPVRAVAQAFDRLATTMQRARALAAEVKAPVKGTDASIEDLAKDFGADLEAVRQAVLAAGGKDVPPPV